MAATTTTRGAKPSVKLPDLAEWPDRERAQKEKEVLGFYLTSHPLDEHKHTLSKYCSHTTADIPQLKEREEVILGGMISSLKFSTTRNPQPGKPSKYVMFDLEDVDGTIRSIVWPEQFAEMGQLVVADAILLVRGAIDRRGGEEANLVVNELIPLDQLDSRYTTGIVVRIDEREHGESALDKIKEIVRSSPGTASCSSPSSSKTAAASFSNRTASDSTSIASCRTGSTACSAPATCNSSPPGPSPIQNGNGSRWSGGGRAASR